MISTGMQAIYLTRVIISQLEIRYKMSKNRSAIVFLGDASSISPSSGNSLKSSLSHMIKFFSLGLSYEVSDMIDVMIYEP